MSFPAFGRPFGGRGFGRPFGRAGGSAPLTQAQIFDAAAQALSPLLDLRMNIASGTVIPNYGSLGAAQNGTLTLGAGALAQSSPLGAGEAISWDALATLISVPNSAAMDSIPKYTWCFLCKPNSAGENGSAKFYSWANTGTNANTNANKAVQASQSATGNASSLASGTTFLTFGSWHMVFIEYDDTADRKLHLYKGIAGAVTEAGYTTQTAATGTLTVTGGACIIGNRLNADNTFDGSFSRVLQYPLILTAPQKLAMTVAAGV